MLRAVFHKAVGLPAATAVSLFLFSVSEAAAQIPRCAPREEMISTLSGTFTESQKAFGFLSPTLLLEVFASDAGGFTILITGTDGVSCVLVVGTGWEVVPGAEDDV